MENVCAVDDCDRPAAGRGMCGAHYRRWRVHGDTRPHIPILRTLRHPEIVDRFEDLTDSGHTLQEAVDAMPVHPRTICRAYQSEHLPVPPGLWAAEKRVPA